MPGDKKTPIKNFIQYYQLLSIDVLLGVLAGAIMAVKITDIHPGFAWWIVLPSCVWWIYLTDHLIDGLKQKGGTQNLRHHFFYQNKTIFLVLLVFLSLVNMFLIVFFLPKELIVFGGITGIFVLTYLAGVRYIKTKNYFMFPKEFIVAALYAGGIWGGLFFMDYGNFNKKWLIPLVGYFLVTVLNLFIYSMYEEKTDREDKQITIFTAFGNSRAKKIMIKFFGIAIAFLLFMILWKIDLRLIRFALNVLSGMLAIQLLLFRKPSIFKQYYRYRWVNEGSFLLPSVFLFIY